MALAIITNGQCYRDVVYLNNGSIIKGQITELNPQESLKIETSDGSIFIFEINQVSKCEKELIENTTQDYTIKSTNEEVKNKYPQKGYRGFAEVSYLHGEYMVDSKYDERSNRIAVSTSHGYQINPQIYIGAGLTEEKEIYWEDVILGVFGDLCYNFKNRNNSLFIDIRAGTYFNDGAGLLFNTSVGYRVKNINMSIGYELAPYNYVSYHTNNFESVYASSLVFKIGFDWGSRK